MDSNFLQGVLSLCKEAPAGIENRRTRLVKTSLARRESYFIKNIYKGTKSKVL